MAEGFVNIKIDQFSTSGSRQARTLKTLVFERANVVRESRGGNNQTVLDKLEQ